MWLMYVLFYVTFSGQKSKLVEFILKVWLFVPNFKFYYY